MKTKFFTLISLIFLLISSCNKNDNHPQIALPPATQTGENTLGCKINGVNWVANGKNEPNKHVFVGGLYVYDTSVGHYGNEYKTTFSISAFRLDKTSVNLQIGCEPKVGTYLFNRTIHDYSDESPFLNYGGTYNLTDAFQTDSIRQGSITITYSDYCIVSGTFQFDAINYKTGQVLQVREGRFDMNLCTM